MGALVLELLEEAAECQKVGRLIAGGGKAEPSAGYEGQLTEGADEKGEALPTDSDLWFPRCAWVRQARQAEDSRAADASDDASCAHQWL